jgi:hypothetical protein
MYSPFTVATEGGGVAVGGTGVNVGNAGVGVLVVTREAQALNPKTKNRINSRLRKSFLIRSGWRALQVTFSKDLEEQFFEYILGIIN